MSLGVDSVGERCEQARTVAARSSGQPMAGHVGSAFGFESTFKKKGIVLNTQGGGNEGGSGGLNAESPTVSINAAAGRRKPRSDLGLS